MSNTFETGTRVEVNTSEGWIAGTVLPAKREGMVRVQTDRKFRSNAALIRTGDVSSDLMILRESSKHIRKVDQENS